MVQKSKSKSKSEADKTTPTSSYTRMESIRYVVAVLIILLGIYAFFSTLFYLFHWKADISLLNGIDAEKPDFKDLSYGNMCGKWGATIGHILVGKSFGAVGVFVPILMILMGVDIFTYKRKLFLNRNAVIMVLLLLLTSLTFGCMFGTSWDMFGSGLGGEYGIAIASKLESIGIGVVFLLVGAWLALGVYINRNFINVVNKAGNSALSGGGKIISFIKSHKTQNDISSDDVDNSDDKYQQSAETENINEEEFTMQPEREQVQFVQEVEEDVFSEEPLYKEDENPFKDYLESQVPLEINVAIASDDDAITDDELEKKSSDRTSDDDPFTEVPITQEQTTAGTVVYVEKNQAKELNEDDLESSLYDPMKDIYSYERPAPSLLEDYQSNAEVDNQEIYDNKAQIEQTLSHFGIPIQNIKATVGPTITLYEIVQAPGVKISKIQGLENDIAQSLKALGIRIIAPIPGKGTIGIEVPNRNKQIVSMRSSILSKRFQEMKAELPIVIGRTIQNENYVFDLAKMPHLLVAGATGQGKSVGLNAIITSLLYRKHPAELKFVMIDPKMVEFSPYRSLEYHFMAKMESEEDVIITDPKKAVYTLNAICEEMENRLKLLSKAGVRNIAEYNDKFKQRILNPEKGHFFMPYIVVVIDEFADLIMIAKEVETPVMRIAQKARAVGIHLIVATQRPDVKVITGGIKANFPARIAFRVTQMIDSRTIIDQPGANQLIGRGDMLFSKDGELTRIQCALVETDEVTRVVNHISRQQGYAGAYKLPDYTPEGGGDSDFGSESGPAIKYDSLFAEVARAAVSNGGISTSAIQRNYEVGFNRAGRIMTQLERAGIVGRQEGAKPRDILYHDMPSLEAKLQGLGVF